PRTAKQKTPVKKDPAGTCATVAANELGAACLPRARAGAEPASRPSRCPGYQVRWLAGALASRCAG
ncbi:MAG: hypothetical protein J2P30_18570, partial [Actinobacteria bacterium]|nr:hypothetical protein [Actinomycetota bacterium]